MNPFVNPEFWLSLAFFAVMGLLLFSPVQRVMGGFFSHQRQTIQDQISQAQEVLNEAKDLLQKTQQKTLLKSENQQTSQKIKAIQNEFDEKIKRHIQAQEQDFQIRAKMMALRMKNDLRKELLDKTESRLLGQRPLKQQQEVSHLIKVLHQNENQLKQILSL